MKQLKPGENYSRRSETISRYVGGGSEFSLSFIINNPEEWEKAFNMKYNFTSQLADVFKEIVFECHRYLIRVTPMLTGRLRAGWTSYLAKYSQDYTAAFLDVSLVEAHIEPLSSLAINEGMLMGYNQETPLNVSLYNDVPYGEYVEWGTSVMDPRNFTQKALYKGEFIFGHTLDNWLRATTLGFEFAPGMVQEAMA